MFGDLEKLGKPCTLLLDHRRARQTFQAHTLLFAFADLLVCMFKMLKVGVAGVLGVLGIISQPWASKLQKKKKKGDLLLSSFL